MKYSYTLYLYYNDIRLIKHETDFTSWEQFYKIVSLPFINDSLYNKGQKLESITIACRLCLNHYLQCINKNYSLSWEDVKLVLCSYFTLFKFNKIDSTNIIFIKNKWLKS